MLEFLPQNVKNGLRHVNLQYVYEIRLRVDKPTTVNFRGRYCYLSEYGVTSNKGKAVYCTVEDLSNCIYYAGNYSVYSVEEQLKKGFVTARGGVRIGIAGEFVFAKGQPLSLKNFNGLCIRIPHEIVGCGEMIYQRCMSDKAVNLLLMSKPGLGKTTILRDLGRILSERTEKNILICDERGEIAVGEIGDSCDVVGYADKATAFEVGIRALRPDVIITDEITHYDLKGIEKAIFAGVSVIASAHFSDMRAVPQEYFSYFDRFVLLDEQKIGYLKAIYNEKGEELI